MKILDYFIASFARKKARRITQEYGARIESFDLTNEGRIDFANWDNPLVYPITITQELVDFYRKFIHEGDLVIDIGANIGDTTVPMALAAGNTGTALAFDPNPYVFKILQKNASLNPGRQNIIPLQYAITVKEEEFYYVSSEASFGNGGISLTKKSIHGKFVYPEKIKGVNLLQLLEERYSDKLEKLSFIKIDAEGYDKEIIKSISDLIEKYKPTIVAESFEFSSAEDKMELYDVISKHGYEVFYFEDFNVNTKIIKIENSNAITRWKGNINIYGVPVNKN